MLNTNNLKFKVCGMKLAANIAGVAALRPDYLGFIFYEKSPRYISEVSAELIKYVPEEIKTTGVFVDETLEKVVAKVKSYNLKAVQLHGQETEAYCLALKDRLPALEIIKAFGIQTGFDFSVLAPYLDVVDYFLFDTKTNLHGGSGQKFDWTVLSAYPYQKPYFLSGGIDLVHLNDLKKLTDERLYAIDVNSKFEVEPGVKDIEKLQQFKTSLV